MSSNGINENDKLSRCRFDWRPDVSDDQNIDGRVEWRKWENPEEYRNDSASFGEETSENKTRPPVTAPKAVPGSQWRRRHLMKALNEAVNAAPKQTTVSVEANMFDIQEILPLSPLPPAPTTTTPCDGPVTP